MAMLEVYNGTSIVPAAANSSGQLVTADVGGGGGGSSSPPTQYADDYAKVQSTNSTDATFPATIPTTTQPAASATRGVITWAGRESLQLVFFGVGADNTTFDYRVVGWQKIATLWVPTPLVKGGVILSTVVGVAAAAVLDTERFADTITADYGIGIARNPSVANTAAASLEVPAGPYDYLEVCFDMTGATSGNALYSAF